MKGSTKLKPQAVVVVVCVTATIILSIWLGAMEVALVLASALAMVAKGLAEVK